MRSGGAYQRELAAMGGKSGSVSMHQSQASSFSTATSNVGMNRHPANNQPTYQGMPHHH